jgi:hypothetical protein
LAGRKPKMIIFGLRPAKFLGNIIVVRLMISPASWPVMRPAPKAGFMFSGRDSTSNGKGSRGRTPNATGLRPQAPVPVVFSVIPGSGRPGNSPVHDLPWRKP